MYTGLSNLGLSGYHSQYSELKEQAIAAARRNNASLWFAGAPADLAGFVWQDSAGTTPATGTDPIGRLTDRAGSNAATQGTTANKPTLEAPVNGFIPMRFDGTDFLAGPNPDSPAQEFFCFAGSVDSYAALRICFGRYFGNTGLEINTRITTGVLDVSIGLGSSIAIISSPSPVGVATPFVVSALGGATSQVFLNGASLGTAGTYVGATAANATLALGARRTSSTANALVGRGFLFAHGTTLPNAADRMAIERFGGFLGGVAGY